MLQYYPVLSSRIVVAITTLHHLLLRPENFAVQVETKTGLQIVGHMQNNLAFVCARLGVC